ncbi:hypothetical protein [Bifidobacterium mongoliense]|uniref:Holin n=1 Tax=Bifidobacterium mongoliense TaxID=518643 RepID=A0A423UDZ4_9BIFI|nr:hypothetical protein [Bifidobacterium mongoliense]ROT86928.1 hypothetical protein BMONG18_0927 [Bifidobacterium mongoliense]
MTIMQTITAIVSALIVPFLVQAIKTHAMSGNIARFVSILVSLLAGVATGFVGGLPAEPGAWMTCIFAVVGGVQTAYAAFRAVGVTSRWLDALLNLGSITPEHADK